MFIKGIKLLLTGRQSRVNLGGHTTQFFNLERGVPQGDPVSAYLFIMALEILNIAIKNNKTIKKVQLEDNISICTEIYADDLSIILPRSATAINPMAYV